MKNLMKSILGLQMTAVFLTTALAAPATALAGPAAAHPVPFKGSVHAVETIDVQFPTLFTDGIGTGTATHLGRFTVTYHFVVDIPTRVGIGPVQFIAANGDILFAESIGQANPTEDPDVSFIVETQTITGGTGRFAGATGSFTVERLINLVTGATSGSFDGAILMHH